MLTCMKRRHVLFYLFLALNAADRSASVAFLVRASETLPRGSPFELDIRTILSTTRHAAMLDEIDTLMGMLEIEQAVSAQDRGIRQCAATRYLSKQRPRQAAT